MLISSANSAAKIPHVFGDAKGKSSCFTPTHVGSSFVSFNFHYRSRPISSQTTASVSNHALSSLTMEGQYGKTVACPEADKYGKELEVAVRAIQLACSLCQRVQESFFSKTNNQIKSKDDDSLVTIAGNPRCLEMASC